MFNAHVTEITAEKERERQRNGWEETEHAKRKKPIGRRERRSGKRGRCGALTEEGGGDNLSLAVLVSHYSSGEFAKR